MSARSDLPSGSPSIHPDRPEPSGRAVAAERPSAWLITAIAVAVVGALLTGLAPVVGVVTPRTPPAFSSWPVLLLLAALPPILAYWFARRGNTVLAAALLLGPAALAPGRMVLDSQLAVDAGLAARPELLLPFALVRLTPSLGLGLLMCGHAAAIVAGALAMTGVGRTREPVPGGFDVDTLTATTRRQGQLAFVLCAAVLGAVGVLLAQFGSSTPFLVPRAAVDSPLPVFAGSVLVAIGLPTVGGYVAGSADREMARGGLLGLAIALAAIVVPPLVAATVRTEIRYGTGAVVGLLAALALAGLAWSAGRSDDRDRAAVTRIPSLARLLPLAGGLSVLAGALAIVGAVSPQWELPGIGSVSYPARMLWPSGLMLVVLGGGLLLPATALRIRPALSVAWVVVPMAATAALDTVFAAVQGAGANAGAGAWVAGLAAVLAMLTGVAAAFAGAVERDDVDLTEMVVRRRSAVLSVVVFPLAVASFATPVLTAPGFTPPGLFGDFQVTSWGLVLGLVAVIVAIALAPLCRPERAAALLGGAALTVLMRVLELPLTEARVAGAGPGAGLWWSLACLVALVVGVVIGLRGPAEGSN